MGGAGEMCDLCLVGGGGKEKRSALGAVRGVTLLDRDEMIGSFLEWEGKGKPSRPKDKSRGEGGGKASTNFE